MNGKKHGKGRFTWSDGSYYFGDFENGLFHGEGEYYFKDSDKTYNGEFRDGRLEGYGRMDWGDGRTYVG